MCILMNQIDDVGNEELQRIFREGDSCGVGDKMREVWKLIENNKLNYLQNRNVPNERLLLQITSSVITSVIICTTKHKNTVYLNPDIIREQQKCSDE